MSMQIKRSFISGKNQFFVCLLSFLFVLILLASCDLNKPQAPLSIYETATTSPTGTSEADSILSILPTLSRTLEIIASQSVNLETTLFNHPQSLYSIMVPKSWSVDKDAETITFKAPQEEATLALSVSNTGYPLDKASFSRFVENDENNKSSTLERLVEISRNESSDENELTIEKSYYDQDKLKRWLSFYRQENQMIFKGDFIIDENAYKAYSNVISDLFSSLSVNEQAVAKLPLYSFDMATLHSNDHFSFLAPPYWNFERVDEDNATVETFTSPDENAVIQAIVYDDGVPTSKSLAAGLTLTLLRENYTKDIVITSDELLGDGREKLTWHSDKNNYQGITSFTTQGSGVNILTVMWNDDQAEFYQSILEDVFDSYTPDTLPEDQQP